MIRPNLKIPKVAAAALVFGVGCDNESAVEKVAGSYCRFAEECDSDFSDYYASVAECKTVIATNIQSYADQYSEAYGDACGDALVDLYQCYVSVLDTSTCSRGDAYDCDDEYYELYDLCYTP